MTANNKFTKLVTVATLTLVLAGCTNGGTSANQSATKSSDSTKVAKTEGCGDGVRQDGKEGCAEDFGTGDATTTPVKNKTVQQNTTGEKYGTRAWEGAVLTDGYVLDDSHLVYLTAGEAVAMIKNSTNFILYIGRPTCPYCHMYRKLQDKALKALDTTIYTVNADDFRRLNHDRQGYKDYQTLLKLAKQDTVPNVVHFQDGQKAAGMSETVRHSNADTVQAWFDKENATALQPTSVK